MSARLCVYSFNLLLLFMTLLTCTHVVSAELHTPPVKNAAPRRVSIHRNLRRDAIVVTQEARGPPKFNVSDLATVDDEERTRTNGLGSADGIRHIEEVVADNFSRVVGLSDHRENLNAEFEEYQRVREREGFFEALKMHHSKMETAASKEFQNYLFATLLHHKISPKYLRVHYDESDQAADRLVQAYTQYIQTHAANIQ